MYNFSGLTDLELVLLQSETRRSPFPGDKEFLDAVLEELRRRHAAIIDQTEPDIAKVLREAK